MSSSPESEYFVRIGTVMTPNTFWVTQIPLGVSIVESKFSKILDMEHCLFEEYNNEENKDWMDDIPVIRIGVRVACRKHSSHRKWYRGEIVNVLTLGGKLSVQIFLIDYGEFLPTVPVETCVRKLLSHEMVTTQPLAFQFILAGLCPLTYQINRQIGMKTYEPITTSHWTEVAYKLIADYVNSSPLKLGKVTFWNEDPSGRVHGHLTLLSLNKSINLHDLLIENRLALFLNDKLEKELSFSGAHIHEFKDENILNDSMLSHRGDLEGPLDLYDDESTSSDKEEEEEEESLISYKLKMLSSNKLVKAALLCPVVSSEVPVDEYKVRGVQLIPAGMDLGLLAASTTTNSKKSYSK